ncbi:MAG: PGPGW domain-containing protein [Bryobacteraceae bacterium]|nr:PGPGW domain-containing protein [Bryobacteraceae bacterium]MDW8379046.1 PGPGW domain-containing protein [Bryobacterales bacterium]
MKRILRLFSGFTLLVVGFILALPFVPGPGVALMILGLVILGEEFPWARRIVDWGKRKLESIRPSGSRQNNPPAMD